MIKINVNNVEYVSIGIYIDNQDGTYIYYPESDDIDSWKNTISSLDYINLLFILGQEYYYYSINSLDESSFFSKKVIKNISAIEDYLKKYYDYESYDLGIFLNSKFVDSLWGDLLNFQKNKIKILASDVVIDDLSDTFFIKNKYYKQFIKDTDKIYNSLFISD